MSQSETQSTNREQWSHRNPVIRSLWIFFAILMALDILDEFFHVGHLEQFNTVFAWAFILYSFVVIPMLLLRDEKRAKRISDVAFWFVIPIFSFLLGLVFLLFSWNPR